MCSRRPRTDTRRRLPGGSIIGPSCRAGSAHSPPHDRWLPSDSAFRRPANRALRDLSSARCSVTENDGDRKASTADPRTSRLARPPQTIERATHDRIRRTVAPDATGPGRHAHPDRTRAAQAGRHHPGTGDRAPGRPVAGAGPGCPGGRVPRRPDQRPDAVAGVRRPGQQRAQHGRSGHPPGRRDLQPAAEHPGEGAQGGRHRRGVQGRHHPARAAPYGRGPRPEPGDRHPQAARLPAVRRQGRGLLPQVPGRSDRTSTGSCTACATARTSWPRTTPRSTWRSRISGRPWVG